MKGKSIVKKKTNVFNDTFTFHLFCISNKNPRGGSWICIKNVKKMKGKSVVKMFFPKQGLKFTFFSKSRRLRA